MTQDKVEMRKQAWNRHNLKRRSDEALRITERRMQRRKKSVDKMKKNLEQLRTSKEFFPYENHQANDSQEGSGES